MGLVILKTIGPWHVGVLDVDDPSICRLLWCDRKVIGSEVRKCIRSVAKLRQRVMNAVEAEVMTALERFNVFGCHFVHPPGDLSAMLADEGIDSSGEGVEDRVDLPIDFVLPLHDTLQGAKQALQVVSIPAVFVGNELKVALPQGFKAENLRPASLGIAVLEHHPLEVVLRLSISVAKESRFHGVSHDVRNPVLVPVNGDLPGQRISGVCDRDTDQKHRQEKPPINAEARRSPLIRVHRQFPGFKKIRVNPEECREQAHSRNSSVALCLRGKIKT